ncbi:MAG: DUF4173 domain-containing protein [Actinomycetota bacterium]
MDRPIATHPSAFITAAVLSGLMAAAWLPDSPGPGIFIPLVALTAGAAVVLAGSLEWTPQSISLASTAVLLCFTAALRAAEWVVIVNLLAACGLAVMAVSVRGPFAPLLRMHLLLGFFIRSAFPNGLHIRHGPLLTGLTIGGALALIFGGLFASADAAFSQFVDAIIPDWNLGSVPLRAFIFGSVIIATTAVAASSERFDEHALHVPHPNLKLERTESIAALVVLDLLFASFVVVQITVLFAGHAHVLATTGLTYSEYARQGFFQLIVVAILTLAVIAMVARRDDAVLRVLLGVLIALTMVILVSALKRLGLYEDAFGLTRQRLLAQALVGWLGGLFLLVALAGLLRRSSWLPFACAMLTGASLLAFTAINPDALIARRNIERFNETGKLDVYYLSTLRADAAEELANLPEPQRSEALAQLTYELSLNEPWSSWNLSRQRARFFSNLPTVAGGCYRKEGSAVAV